MRKKDNPVGLSFFYLVLIRCQKRFPVKEEPPLRVALKTKKRQYVWYLAIFITFAFSVLYLINY